MAAEVYISYSPRDSAIAGVIRSSLEAEGILCRFPCRINASDPPDGDLSALLSIVYFGVYIFYSVEIFFYSLSDHFIILRIF